MAAYLIPAEAVDRVSDRALHLSCARGTVIGSPSYSPQSVTEDSLRDLCCHYGIRPYWEGRPGLTETRLGLEA